MALAAEGVVSGYSRDCPVIQGVTLEIACGEFLALLGPNGCGKSTLLRTLAGILPPAQGSILLDGHPLGDLPPEEKPRHIGYLAQEIHPALSYQVEEVVALGARCASGALSSESIKNALAKADALSLAGRHLEELSGGERRRVCLAGVLAQNPRFLLLDEPAVMLDLSHQAAAFRTLRKLADEGIGILCITHDPNLASAHANRLVILEEGKVKFSGAPKETLTSEAFKSLYGDAIEILPRGEGGVAVLPR